MREGEVGTNPFRVFQVPTKSRTVMQQSKNEYVREYRKNSQREFGN